MNSTQSNQSISNESNKRKRASSFSESHGSQSPTVSQSRMELIERYEFLADQYEASLNEREQLKKQKRTLELELSSLKQQHERLNEMIDSLTPKIQNEE